ncbi:OB-fold domain-containing protein [Thalassobaculum sp. OXR-137]|uniref:Zn-ribbon domain-containing OB-fold protein n=1 Tax=Thalassobaculum sp. OXR-137 TaxID=3100173 RepID=UPI002AC8ABF7|nr:OB-fold domain-containing protein [Thalassobaculum sp. OXR-137]WPZ34939.1 OB-fold domain-containing protein [Thalassobaculum sp. OXR-137]
MPDAKPAPGGPDATYFAYLEAGDWRIQRCGSCDTHIFQPRVMCPSCGGEDLAWVAPSGKGTVHSTTVIRRRPESGGDYNVCLVDLDEGVRMMSRVEGVDPTAVSIGMPVAARLAEQDGQKVVVFDPEKGASA